MNYPAWQLKKADPAAETSLAGAGCGVLLRRVLAARGGSRHASRSLVRCPASAFWGITSCWR